jgi:hypothetical protein
MLRSPPRNSGFTHPVVAALAEAEQQSKSGRTNVLA